MEKFCEDEKVAIPERYVNREFRKQLSDEGSNFHMDFCTATLTVKSNGTLQPEDVKWEEGCSLKFTIERSAGGPAKWNAEWRTLNVGSRALAYPSFSCIILTSFLRYLSGPISLLYPASPKRAARKVWWGSRVRLPTTTFSSLRASFRSCVGKK